MPIDRRQFLFSMAAGAAVPSTAVDLWNAHIILPAVASARMHAYASMFADESQKRCHAIWEPGSGKARLRLSVDATYQDEGFQIESSGLEVRVTGHSERGLLFGVGQLLRSIDFGYGSAVLPRERASITSTPQFALRGHQLGYRPKTNSYDGWDIADWHQYIRDLAVFGCNTIELLPPHTDDDAGSPHFPLPPEQMMVEVSRLADRYGLDVWMWFPALDDDSWEQVFEKLPRLDAVFTPGGDPGNHSPAALLAILEKQKQVLRRSHLKAQMWVSPQSFAANQLEEFYTLVNRAKWLDGVVHGPQCRDSLPEMRARLRTGLPVRLYPDITHSLQCQFPVSDWDRAFAATEGRECINPRPHAHAAIARQYLPGTAGFISYSEGCNDDVNKVIWSAAAWNPDFDVDQCLLEYSRYFIGPELAPEFAAGLAGLERNWIGPAANNQAVQTTLDRFHHIERAATPALLRNWRFQQAIYRAYFDAYTQRRLLGHVDVGYRAKIVQQAEALFQSIHMQLNVERYKAESVSRGANLDTLDAPLFGRAENVKLPDGTLHDDLGDPSNRPHLVLEPATQPDPEFRRSVLVGFLYPDTLGEQYPVAWRRWGETLFDTPLRLQYNGLDTRASYKVRVVYSGDARSIRVQLSANGVQIHPLIEKPWPPTPLEFPVPHAVTAQGSATFAWSRAHGLGGSGRGCQISEVWLIRQ